MLKGALRASAHPTPINKAYRNYLPESLYEGHEECAGKGNKLFKFFMVIANA